MPAFNLPGAELREIIAFLRTLAPEQRPEVRLKIQLTDGKTLEGLVQMPDEPRQVVHGVGTDQDLVVPAADALSDQAGMLELTVRPLGEPHAGRHQRPA